MLDAEQIQVIRTTLHSVFERCDIAYKVAPFDDTLHQDCIDEACRRGYPLEGDRSVRKFLRTSVEYATAAGRHLSRPRQIWIALYTTCIIYVDEIPSRFPSDVQYLYPFHERFFGKRKQANAILDAFADLILQASDQFQPIPAKLVMTSSLNFVTANILEYEVGSMQIIRAAKRYSTYHRTMTALAEGYGYMAFPSALPLTEYIQAMPDVMLFVNDMNDVLSFYKEELAGENGNQIALLAARDQVSHLKAFQSLSEVAVGHHKKILEILEGFPEAYEAFKHFGAGYIDYHIGSGRYKLTELAL